MNVRDSQILYPTNRVYVKVPVYCNSPNCDHRLSFNPSICTSARVFAGIAAIGLINEALDEGDPTKTLAMLQNSSAKLTDVDPSVAQHYHDILLEARREKAHVRDAQHTTAAAWSCM